MPLICFKGHILLLKTTSLQITPKASYNNSIQEKKNSRNFIPTVLTLKFLWMFQEHRTCKNQGCLTDGISSLQHFNIRKSKHLKL